MRKMEPLSGFDLRELLNFTVFFIYYDKSGSFKHSVNYSRLQNFFIFIFYSVNAKTFGGHSYEKKH